MKSKYLVVPAGFYEKKLENEKPHRLKSIMHLFEIEYSVNVCINNEAETHDIPHLKSTREGIKKQINLYKVYRFGNICAFAKKEQCEVINEIIDDIRDNFTLEKEYFGEKCGFFEAVMGHPENSSNKENPRNCWIFLKQNFILFTPENSDKITSFFYRQEAKKPIAATLETK